MVVVVFSSNHYPCVWANVLLIRIVEEFFNLTLNMILQFCINLSLEFNWTPRPLHGILLSQNLFTNFNLCLIFCFLLSLTIYQRKWKRKRTLNSHSRRHLHTHTLTLSDCRQILHKKLRKRIFTLLHAPSSFPVEFYCK